MNETIKNIKDRRSIRSFKTKQLSENELNQILDAAISAPSAKNQQKWHFTVIQNQNLLNRMVAIIKKNIIASGNEFFLRRATQDNYHTFYNAPTVIMVSADESAHWVMIDCGIAMENMVLAAQSLNIGSCIIATSKFLFDSDEGKKLIKELGIPKGYMHICTVALGYREGETPESTPRNKDVVNFIRE